MLAASLSCINFEKFINFIGRRQALNVVRKLMKSNCEILIAAFCTSLCLFTACSSKKIEITSEYIINENWNRRDEQALANSITINRIIVRRDSIMNAFSDLGQTELLSNLEEDSSFMHYTNIRIKEGESYSNKKIYFNRDNGFYWGSNSRHNSADKVKTIGNLQKNNWYKFSYLGTMAVRYIFVYVDSANHVHRFDVFHSNY